MQLTSTPISYRSILNRRLETALAIALLMFSSTNSSAQEPGSDGLIWGIGIGALSEQKPFTDIDRNTIALPLIYFENRYIRWFGPVIDIKLPGIEFSEFQQLNFSITGEYDFGGFDDDEAAETPILNGMDERKGGYWAGAKIEWRNPIVDVNLKWLSKVSGDGDGERLTFALERNWMFAERLILSPRVQAIWNDANYIDYQYGVQEHEVRFDRPTYVGEAGLNLEMGVRGTYFFDEHNSVFLDVGVTSLADEIQASPLVNASTENSVLFVYMYSF